MKLVSHELKIKQIMLDPLNPRFEVYDSIKEQNELISKLADESESGRQLFRSMEKDVKWINRIVVKNVKYIEKEIYTKIPSIQNYEFIVVEGNTRLACLKHKDMVKYNGNSKIPVLEATKEENESLNDYNKELRLIQGIANVTVVQEWSAMSKAKHIYNMYKDSIIKCENSNITTIAQNISIELGISANEVREAIRRYAIYSEVANLTNPISIKDWPYLEVFDLNDDIRNAIGLINKGIIQFEWTNNKNIDDENITNKKELLIKIPIIIESAKKENMTSKEFRKPFRMFFNENKDKSAEEIKNELMDSIIESNKPRPWESLVTNVAKKNKDSEGTWKRDLKYFSQIIDTYPVMSKWSKKYTKELEEIMDTIKRILEIIKK